MRRWQSITWHEWPPEDVPHYLSMLYDIAQEWMALDQLRKEPYEQDLLVQRWLNGKGLHQQAEQVRAKVLRNLDQEEGSRLQPGPVSLRSAF